MLLGDARIDLDEEVFVQLHLHLFHITSQPIIMHLHLDQVS